MPEIEYKGAEDHGPPGEQPAPQGRGVLHEVPRGREAGRAEAARAHRAGPLLQAAEPRHGRAHGAHRGSPEGAGRRRRCDRRTARRRALPAAAGAVLPRLRRGGELHRLPRAAGGAADPRRLDRLRAAGPARAARRLVQADGEDRRRPDGTARARARRPGRRRARLLRPPRRSRRGPRGSGGSSGRGADRERPRPPRAIGAFVSSDGRYGAGATTGRGRAWTLSTDCAPVTPWQETHPSLPFEV